MVQWSIPTHTDTLLFVEFRVRDQLVCEFVFFLRLFFLAFFVVVDDRCCHMGTGLPGGVPVDRIRVAGGPPAAPAER